MTSPPTNRRSWLRPRFSLRVLLLAFTAFAIGFPIWWRWPYEEVTEFPSADQRMTTTWQRQWGGGKQKCGLETYLMGNVKLEETIYRDGKKNGLCVWYAIDMSQPQLASAGPYLYGQYVDDQKHGVWTEIKEGQKTFTTYDHDKQVSP